VPGLFGRLAASQHVLVAVLSAWLILTSPWVHMLRRIPRNAGFLEYAHIAIGLVVLVLAVTFTVSCLQLGRWRHYFPWLTGNFSPIGRDVRGLFRGRIPSSEGSGLFGTIKGLLLASLLAAAVTGAGWLVFEGSAEAVHWRRYHIAAAQLMIVCYVLHIIAASLHLLEFIRE